MNKLDRAVQETNDEKSYLSEEETLKVKEIIKKLDSYIDLITQNLNSLISDYLKANVESIKWIGTEKDYVQ